MGRIKKLNQNNEDLYPVTLEDAVFDTEGVNIGSKIQDIKDSMIYVEDFDEIEDIENNTTVTYAPKIHMYVKEFGAVGDGVTDDTNAIQSALDNLNTIIEFEVGKTYKITRPLRMKYGVEIIGNKSFIITDVAFTEPLMLIGHSCEVSNLSFNLNDKINNNIIDVPILEINSEYIKSTYDECDSHIWSSSIFNIYLDNVHVYKWRRDDVCAGSALNIEATGKGVSGWGISVYNCNFLGHFDKAITIQTLQKYNDAEDVILPWMNDIKFNNCKINYSKLGFYINSENLANNTNDDKIPKGPEAVNVYGCGMQANYFTTYFAEIVSGNRIYFNDCEPWDWHEITDENVRNNPYKIHTNKNNYGIAINRGNVINEGDLITSPVRKTKGEPVLDEANTLYNKSGSGDNGVFTFGDLYELIPGSYCICEGQGNLLGLTDNLDYGGMLLVFNGFNGIKNFMVYAATIKDRECNIVTNVNTKVYTMCVPIRHLQKTDSLINTTITQNHWVKIMDETCIGVEGFNKPMVGDLNNIVEANNVRFIGALNTANGTPNNNHFNGISVGGNPGFHINNALSWQLGADASQKNLVFRIKTSTAEDSWTEWGQLYGSKNMPAGSSTYRPTDVAIGSIYFDRTLNKPIWWNGVNWVDATGTNV